MLERRHRGDQTGDQALIQYQMPRTLPSLYRALVQLLSPSRSKEGQQRTIMLQP